MQQGWRFRQVLGASVYKGKGFILLKWQPGNFQARTGTTVSQALEQSTSLFRVGCTGLPPQVASRTQPLIFPASKPSCQGSVWEDRKQADYKIILLAGVHTNICFSSKTKVGWVTFTRLKFWGRALSYGDACEFFIICLDLLSRARKFTFVGIWMSQPTSDSSRFTSLRSK